MYYEDFENAGQKGRSGDDIYSKPVRAGKRTYFFDVKATKGNDYYLTITESKRRVEKDGRFVYDKHKIFLYKEDFDKFSEGLQEVIEFIRRECPIPERKGDENSAEPDKEQPATPASFTDVSFDEL
ncbi:MAG: PUR family DNA/RNA-binding protein [Bacteroidales bacterium]|nr:PUR family DNA/RNA-binding protein [Bacteroidales bacterium]